MTLVERILAIAVSLDDSGLDWAFGGAFALAYATEEPRGTRDIDVNVFVPSSEVDHVVASLPPGVAHGAADRRRARADDQVRLWWEDTPVDLFFVAGESHLDVATRVRAVPFGGRMVRILCAEDLAVFKAKYDRPNDWVDIEAMAEAGTLDRRVAASRLATILGDDPRVGRLRDA
jgi:hypothetical protein